MNNQKYISPQLDIAFMELDSIIAISIGGGTEGLGVFGGNGGNFEAPGRNGELDW